MIVAIVRVSSWMRTFSLASTAWCRPSLQRRPGEHAAGELVDDEDLAVVGDDQVVHVALVERVRAQALVQDVERLEVDGIVEVARCR